MIPASTTPTTPPTNAGDRTSMQLLLDTGRRLNLEAHKHPHVRGYPYVVLRDSDGGEAVHMLDRGSLGIRPDYWQTTVPMDDVGSFCAYVQLHQQPGTHVYASLNPVRVVAVLNDHARTPGESAYSIPDWRDHRALFVPSHSVEWTEWLAKNNKPFEGNVAWAEWLEDQHFDIVDPPGATMLEIALNFRVHDAVAFSNPIRLDNGRTEFQFHRLVDGHAQGAAGKIQIPELFTVSIPVWSGLGQRRYQLSARLRYRLKDAGLRIWYTLVRPAKVVEEAFSDLITEIRSNAGEVLFGRPE